MTKINQTIYRSTEPALELMTCRPGQIRIPGTSYTWEQLQEMRDAIDDNLSSRGLLPPDAPPPANQRICSLFLSRDGTRELARVVGDEVSVTAYELNEGELWEFAGVLDHLFAHCAPEADIIALPLRAPIARKESAAALWSSPLKLSARSRRVSSPRTRPTETPPGALAGATSWPLPAHRNGGT